MADVNSIYAQALAQQNSIYSQVTAGYNQLLANQQAQQQGVISGYNALSGQVQGAIQGVDASQRQAIQDTYRQQWGSQQQQMINSGLGNTTVRNSINRGLTLDENKAEVALSNQMAQLKAGYLSQIGLAGLGYQGQALQSQASLGSAGLNTQAGMGNTFASIYGAYGRSALDQQALQQQMQLAQRGQAMQQSGQAAQGYAQQRALDAQRAMERDRLGYQWAALNSLSAGGYPSYSSVGSGQNLYQSRASYAPSYMNMGQLGDFGAGGGGGGGANTYPGSVVGGIAQPYAAQPFRTWAASLQGGGGDYGEAGGGDYGGGDTGEAGGGGY